jgi:hypothetical protein
VVIQNDSAQNAVIPTAMGARRYQGEKASMAPHCAATRISMVPNVVALTELVLIWAPRNVGTQNDLARNAVTQFAPALHFVVGLGLARVIHFFAVAVQTLGSAIHSGAQAAPARFAHDA